MHVSRTKIGQPWMNNDIQYLASRYFMKHPEGLYPFTKGKVAEWLWRVTQVLLSSFNDELRSHGYVGIKFD